MFFILISCHLDPTWHKVLLDEKAEDYLIKLLRVSLYRDGKVHLSSFVNPKLEIVFPCLKIIRLLTEYNVRCRHKLAQDASLYRLLSRHALIASAGSTVRHEVSCLLSLLLFDEIARSPMLEEREGNTGDISFALPAEILKRW